MTPSCIAGQIIAAAAAVRPVADRSTECLAIYAVASIEERRRTSVFSVKYCSGRLMERHLFSIGSDGHDGAAIIDRHLAPGVG
jgi:hypothetical protein